MGAIPLASLPTWCSERGITLLDYDRAYSPRLTGARSDDEGNLVLSMGASRTVILVPQLT